MGELDPTPPARASRRPLVIIVAVVTVLVAGVLLLLLLRPDPGEPSPRARETIAAFEGTGSETTETFTVEEGWQIQWQNSGSEFRFAITGDRNYGTVINQKGPGRGVTSPVGGGTFRLKITAKGGWSITIIQA